MAKLIARDEWRVVATGILDLSLPNGPRLQVRVKDAVIPPQRLGDFGWVSMSDRMASRDIEGDYERRCEEIVRALRSQHPGVKATVEFNTTETCSHCGCGWDVMTAEVQEKYPEFDEPIGMPMCCEAAQDEWRATRAGVA
jgi:hypothetical protein